MPKILYLAELCNQQLLNKIVVVLNGCNVSGAHQAIKQGFKGSNEFKFMICPVINGYQALLLDRIFFLYTAAVIAVLISKLSLDTCETL